VSSALELGLDTFGDITVDGNGRLKSHAQVLRDVVDEAALADDLGVFAFGVGEHHRPDFAISAPEVLLGAIAGRTRRILLGSAVTVLSSDDPIRVYQRFSTLDAASSGRAEIILGRGSFTESFPLFGYNLDQYELLFEEKLALFYELLQYDRTGTPVSWRGTHRTPLSGQRVFPNTDRGGFKAWIGVGGSPESVVRAARYELPLMLAIIGGSPRRFGAYVDLYYQALQQRGAASLPVGVHSPGYVAETDARARQEFWPPFREMRDRIGKERGWPPSTANEMEQEIEHGSLYVGSPEFVARKIAATVQELGLSRFHMKYSAGTLAHDKLMRCIELFGREVMPRVHALLAESQTATSRA
jgi:probable LLM family oxidoreductase